MKIACQVTGFWAVEGYGQPSSRVYVQQDDEDGSTVILRLPGQGRMRLSPVDARVVGAALVEVANSCDEQDVGVA